MIPNAMMKKKITRTGYCLLNRESDTTLAEITEVIENMPLDCELVANAFETDSFAIVCKEILEDRHNCFWHGQGVDEDTPVPNPTAWIIEWQNRRLA